MSKIIASAAIRGGHACVRRADAALAECLDRYGRDKDIGFRPRPTRCGDSRADGKAGGGDSATWKKRWPPRAPGCPPSPPSTFGCPTWAAPSMPARPPLVAQEAIEVLKPLRGHSAGVRLLARPNRRWHSCASRHQAGGWPHAGIRRLRGRAARRRNRRATGARPAERNLLVFMGASSGGETMAAQLARRGVEMNWETFLVPYGRTRRHRARARLRLPRRVHLRGLKPGGLKETREILLYNQRRVFAFVLALGEVDDEKIRHRRRGHQFRLPVIADTISRRSCRAASALTSTWSLTWRTATCRRARWKCRGRQDPHRRDPHSGAARPRLRGRARAQGRSGHRIRRQAHAMLRVPRLSPHGPGAGWADPRGGARDRRRGGRRAPAARHLVEVAGRKLQPEFESILERHIHSFLSEPMGVMHLGQRDTVWLRISKKRATPGSASSTWGRCCCTNCAMIFRLSWTKCR